MIEHLVKYMVTYTYIVSYYILAGKTAKLAKPMSFANILPSQIPSSLNVNIFLTTTLK